MGELSYEPPPEVHVELIRDWFTPAFRAWNRLVYGRRGFYFVGGCLMPFWLLGVFVKAVIFFSVVALMCAAFLITGTVDCVTYRWRYRRALEEAGLPE